MNELFAINTKPVGTRLDIDTFSTDSSLKIRWHLYLRALAKLQEAPPSDITGYYRLAAIHGWPVVTWPDGKASAGKAIYCKHGTPTFVTWHRVYMLLFEQHILKIAVDLAAQAPASIRESYQKEAALVRIPFWDSAKAQVLPAAVLGRMVSVLIPEESLTIPVPIRNPLFSYFSTGLHHQNYQQETHRDDRDAVHARFISSGIRRTTYQALNTTSYGFFSNARFPGANTSLEVPHGNLHDLTGGAGRITNRGELADPMVTGYDPLFWLLHGQMDHLYALWQEINDDKLFQENTHGVTIDAPLKPFFRAGTAAAPAAVEWTSRMMQRGLVTETIPNTYEFGVQYPETLSTDTPETRKRKVREYMASISGTVSGFNGEYPPGAIPPSERMGLDLRPMDLPENAAIRREWDLLIEYKDNLAQGNFTIYVFLGESGKHPLQWRHEPSFVGSISTFKSSVKDCENCADHEGESVYSSVSLTDKVLELAPANFGGLEKLTTVTEWMTGRLNWKIALADGTEHHISKGNPGDVKMRVNSYMEAYGPRDEMGNPIDCDLEHILGVTFDRQEHRGVTIGRGAKGGQIVVA